MVINVYNRSNICRRNIRSTAKNVMIYEDKQKLIPVTKLTYY
jgi:hypothetical protein